MRHAPLVALCLLFAAAFLALGIWQMERRAWKLDLIARVDARLHAPARPLPLRAAWGRDLAYTRVRVSGVFLHGSETLVQAVTARGAGWWVLTPLRTASGIVLVNRGFVPPERRTPASRREGQVAGQVIVSGLIRTSEPGGAFLRSNDPVGDRWYSRDVIAIALARGMGRTAPFFIDADARANPGGLPVGGLTVVAFHNSHLVYAITWFALGALCLFGAGLAARRR